MKHGDKMIKLTINFWTDCLDSNGVTDEKAAWGSGTVAVRANYSRGIKSDYGSQFKSLEDLPDAVRKACKKAGITLYRTTKLEK